MNNENKFLYRDAVKNFNDKNARMTSSEEKLCKIVDIKIERKYKDPMERILVHANFVVFYNANRKELRKLNPLDVWDKFEESQKR